MELKLGIEQELGDGTGHVVRIGEGLVMIIRAGTGIITSTGISRTKKTNH